MFKELKFNEGNSEAAYSTNVGILLSVLFSLGIFRLTWPADKLGTQDALQQSYDWYKQMFEGGLTGHHGQIADRKLARQNLTMSIKKIMLYLSLMAEQTDITALVHSGVVDYKAPNRRGKAKTVVLNK